MDIVGLGFLLAFLLGLVVIAALGLSMLKALRGTRDAGRGASITPAPSPLTTRPSSLTHGQMFDQAEALGSQLVSGGYMAEAEWQPIFESIAKSLTHRAHGPAAAALPATEAQPAA